jgi:alpha-1,2-mannosyltransferase
VLLSVFITLIVSTRHGFLDLEVYRLGARTWLHHGALYGKPPAVAADKGLPFTYPPTAALMMTPLAVVPLWLAELMATAASLACLGLTIGLVLSRVRPDLDLRTTVTLTTIIVVALSLTEPVRLTLWFGQVNLVLMAAVTLDCLTVKPRWPRGLLVGIAVVTTKLTPAAFLLYFVIRRDWKAASTAAATATAIALSGFLFFPRESHQYWFHTVTDTSRIGSPEYVGNQSIKGMIFRLGLPHSTSIAVWLGVSVAVLCAGAVLMRRLLKLENVSARGTDSLGPTRQVTSLSVTALLVNAAILLLVSPVSWTHHWVWVGPALVTAVAWTIVQPSPTRIATVAGFAILFLIGPGLVPNGNYRELSWYWWQHIPGNAYVLAAAGLFALGLIRMRPPPATSQRPAQHPDNAPKHSGVHNDDVGRATAQ